MTKVTEEELIQRTEYPRITYDALKANIKNATFYNHGLLTICVLELQNGFTVVGESACAVPANYKQDIGERLARTDAEGKIWALMGYELKQKVSKVEAAKAKSDPNMITYIGTKVLHAKPMNLGDYNRVRGWTLDAGEKAETEGYMVEYTDGGPANQEGYKGYVSWSPKEVFENTYEELGNVPQTTFKDRILKEKSELEGKLELLNSFTKTDIFNELEMIDKQNMIEQADAMTKYLIVLKRRINRLGL